MKKDEDSYTPSPQNAEKLTDWANEPKIADLQGDYERSKEIQSTQVAKIEDWNDLIKVEGVYKPKKRRGRSQYAPKLIRRQNEWRYSALTEPFHSAEDFIKVEPVTFEDHEAARQQTILINWQYRTKLNRVKLIDDIVRATVDEGTCIIKVGWKRVVVKEKEEVPVWDYYQLETEEQFEAFQQALQFKQQDPNTFSMQASDELKASVEYYEENDVPVSAQLRGMATEEVEKVKENYPTAEVMDLKNVFIDPSCRTNINDALFVINTYETNQAELLENKHLYKNLNLINWNSDADSDSEHSTGDGFRNFSDPMRRKKVAYDYWGYYDIEGDGVLRPILATWIDNIVIRMVDNPFPDGKPPFVLMNYMPVKRKMYGEPDAELLKDNQLLNGALHRGAIDIIARSANAQTAIFKGALDGVNRIRFDNEENFEINPNNFPNGGIINLVSAEVPNSTLNLLEMNNFEAEALTGIKSFSGGLSGDAYGKVATNTRGVLDAASKRELAILRRISGGVKEMAMKHTLMNAMFLEKEEVIRVTNEEYVEINKDDIQGNFDLKIEISTAEVDEARSNDLGFLLQTIGNTVDHSLTQIVLAEIIELKKMPKLAHQVRNFVKEPSPQEIEMMELEMELKRKEVEKLQSEIDYNNARAMEAMSKANATEVGTNKVLDGSTHEEGMQKAQAQAEANRQLEADKARYAKESKVDDALLNSVTTPEPKQEAPIQIATTPQEMSQYRKENPIFNLGSSKHDASKDKAMNQGNNRL